MHEIVELDAKGLRQFGLMMAGFIAGVFGLVLPWLWGKTFPLWPWGVGAVFAVWALAAPATLNPVYRGWMRVALLIGNVINRIVLGVVFFLVMWPIGLIMRLRGKDPMRRTLDADAESYRVPSQSRPSKHMERPF